MVENTRVELVILECKSSVIPLHQFPVNLFNLDLVRLEEFESPTCRVEAGCSLQLSYRRKNLEQDTRVELVTGRWQRSVLPLN
jgi:hypothetical protein